MMKMTEFMAALQNQLTTQQPNFPNNAESILEVLFDAYDESSGFDSVAIKADFEELYWLMNGKPLKEIDEIIYAVCTLCRDHEKAGFIEGVAQLKGISADEAERAIAENTIRLFNLPIKP